MIEKPKEYANQCFLTAGETDAQGRMPMWLVVSRAIEAATDHANILGIGYERLKQLGIGWVLTRMSVQMLRYPVINETYTVTTWIEGFNRLYSDRCFVITDGEGREVAHIRSMWVAIDMQKRTASDLTEVESTNPPTNDQRQCPLPPTRKLPPLKEVIDEREYTFKYSDLDFNRHVNTVQYVRHILNQWSLDFYDKHEIARFEIGFHQECHYGERVTIRTEQLDPLSYHCEIVKAGTRAVAAAITFRN